MLERHTATTRAPVTFREEEEPLPRKQGVGDDTFPQKKTISRAIKQILTTVSQLPIMPVPAIALLNQIEKGFRGTTGNYEVSSTGTVQT